MIPHCSQPVADVKADLTCPGCGPCGLCALGVLIMHILCFIEVGSKSDTAINVVPAGPMAA